uniref:Uncharacterized protein n=1 Tax=Ciona savignyi TaxID=51511 RepID=H2YZL5_CIOSA
MVNSDEATGRYVFVQDETWMRERSEINFNFNRGNMTGECDLQSGNITVDFNPSVAPLAADIPEDTPLEIQTSCTSYNALINGTATTSVSYSVLHVAIEADLQLFYQKIHL